MPSRAVTAKRDLRTGLSVWEDGEGARWRQRLTATPLRRDIRADVAVVGAGISGAMVAAELALAGHRVVILDRRGPLLGSTMASTALLQSELDVPLIRLIEKLGYEKAVRAWRRARLGLASLHDRTRALGIDCDLRRESSLYLAGDLLGPDGLKEEVALRREAGLPTMYLGRAALRDRFDIGRAAALYTEDSLSANPAAMAAGYLGAALKARAKLHAPANVVAFHRDAQGISLETEGGPVVTARAAVFATGYEFLTRLRMPPHSIQSTWAMATSRQPKLTRNLPMIWEASETYFYMRVLPDGRIVCGGEDEPFSNAKARDALVERKTAALIGKLKKLLPGVDPEPTHAWTGSFGASATGLPTIGPLPRMPNCFAVLGYGGNGITFSRIAAEIVLAALAGRGDPDADLFTPR